ncbi:hypothetical protein CYMTET_15019 [Cymbomonas tetramitiformis]|uniref:Acid phosphatase n=1 Tax=Cymbomonas tetramitiformis TaxID=36881 RepID=A0AAE0GFC4_9CHLO|nr:hypothetical protein CYMTET_15019 [Cymbomonas tetramitiformis]
MQVVASLEQASSGETVPGLQHTPSARLVYLAAHDTNIALLQSLLQVEWIVDGWQRQNIPPGGMFVVELHRPSGGSPATDFVRVYFEAATPEQQHAATQFDPTGGAGAVPSRVEVLVPGCLEFECPLLVFQEVLRGALEAKCVGNDLLRKWIEDSSSLLTRWSGLKVLRILRFGNGVAMAGALALAAVYGAIRLLRGALRSLRGPSADGFVQISSHGALTLDEREEHNGL